LNHLADVHFSPHFLAFFFFQLPNLNAPAGIAAFEKPQDSIQCISDGILGKNTLEMGIFPKSWKSRNQLLRCWFCYQHPFAFCTYHKLWVMNAFVIIYRYDIYIYMFNVSVLESVTLGVFFAAMSVKELSLSQFDFAGYGSSEWIKIMLTHFGDMVRSQCVALDRYGWLGI